MFADQVPPGCGEGGGKKFGELANASTNQDTALEVVIGWTIGGWNKGQNMDD